MLSLWLLLFKFHVCLTNLGAVHIPDLLQYYMGVSFFWIFFSNLISHTIQNYFNLWNEATNLDWHSLMWICNDMSGWRTNPEIASLNLQFAPLHVNLPPDCALIYAGQTLTRSHVSKSPGSNSPLLLPTNSLSQPGAVATTCSVP